MFGNQLHANALQGLPPPYTPLHVIRLVQIPSGNCAREPPSGVGFAQVYWIADKDLNWYDKAVDILPNDPNDDLVTGESCSIAQTLAATCGNGHFWAVPGMELWLLVLGIPALFLALPAVRRANYKLFYISHHQFLVLLPLAYYHAWDLWK